MYERSTNYPGPEKGKKVHSRKKAGDPEGVGTKWKWHSDNRKYQIHPATLYSWKKALEQGAEIVLKVKRPKADPQIKRLEKEN